MDDYAGLDVSMNGTQICVVERDGSVVLEAKASVSEDGNTVHDRYSEVTDMGAAVKAWDSYPRVVENVFSLKGPNIDTFLCE